MSGREHEPISAFFPSIDRNLMRDLDRHLRTSAPASFAEPTPDDIEAKEAALPSDPEVADQRAPQAYIAEGTMPRTSTSDILEAVDQAASAMAMMNARIQELEAKQYELESTNHQLRAKLGELLQSQQAAEASARNDRERAARAEQIAAHHQTRAQVLESDLETALGDLRKIADAITGALGATWDQQGA